ncbi:MAG: hypothetical protein ACTHJW_18025, partial [Streptosporangiaceae bacterium]
VQVPGAGSLGASAGTQSSASETADLPPGQLRRMVVRAEDHQTHDTRFFSALVSNSGDSANWLGDDHAIVTVMLCGGEFADCLDVGDHFALWSGHDLADGIVTRRLFI